MVPRPNLPSVRTCALELSRMLSIVRGFELQQEAFGPTRLEFCSWIERMRTSPESATVFRNLRAGAALEVREGLAVEPDGSFVPRIGLFWARAPAT